MSGIREYVSHFFTRFRTDLHFRILISLYALVSGVLFLYSFTQIDLNLTLISYPFIHALQKPFITLGYYMRPLSTGIYIGLVVGFFLLYLSTLWLITQKKLSAKDLSFVVILLSGILVLSYPAFSHDLFNYMFDAKIFTHYGDNPYAMRALDYPDDPWIRFMHWTHRTYPYGPSFLPITIVLSFIGMNIFPLTLVLFKLLMVGSYLGASFYFYKLAQKIAPENALTATAFFALNPLVIFESLVSSHHDILMMFFAIISVYLYLIKKKFFSFILFLLSVGVKYTTVFLAPMFIIGFHPLLFFAGSVVTFLTVIAEINIQPWYLLWVLPFAALCYRYVFIRILTVFVSLAFLLRYIPFLYEGSWYPSAIPFQHATTYAALIGAVVVYLMSLVRRKKYRKDSTI